MRPIRIAFVVLTLLLFVANVQASVVIDTIAGIPTQPHEEHFNDDSRETGVLASFPILNVGDALEGVWLVNSIGQTGQPRYNTIVPGGGGNADVNIEVTGYFKVRVTSKTQQGTWWEYHFGPDTTFEGTYGTGAMAAIFEDSTPDFNLDAGSLAGILATAQDGIHLASIGYTGTGGVATGGEGWSALTSSDNVSLIGLKGFFDANLNLVTPVPLSLENTFGNFLVIGFSEPSTYGDLSNTQFRINGQVDKPLGTNQYLPINDSADLYFTVDQVVPEPASLLIWGSLAGLGLIAARRRGR